MTIRAVTLFVLLSCVTHAADDRQKQIRFPGAAPATSPVTTLSTDRLYIIDSDVDLLMFQSPEGSVSISRESGPLRIRGKFADGNGNYETRDYKGKWVYTVEPLKSGSEVELIVVPVGAKTEQEATRRRIQLGLAPQPPPPGPQPQPPTPSADAPIPLPGFRVLIVFENLELRALTPNQQSIAYGRRVRDYLDAYCVKGADGKTPEYRVWDQHVPHGNDYKHWADAMKRPRGKLPWVLVSNGAAGFEGPLPATPEEFIALCDKYRK